VDQWREEQRRIPDASGDDYVRATRKRVDDRPGPEIGVGRNDPIAERLHRLR
jgi:hypothetical protein